MQPARAVDVSTVTRDQKHGLLFCPVRGPRAKLKKLDFNCLTAARGRNTTAPENVKRGLFADRSRVTF